MSRNHLLFGAFALLSHPLLAADSPKLKLSVAKTDPPAVVAKGIRAALDPMAVAVADV